MIDLQKSKAAFEEARKFMPGGVNSPVRSYPHMGCPPPFIASAKGSHITDIDGNTYIDYVGSWGPMILGHAHPAVISAICKHQLWRTDTQGNGNCRTDSFRISFH